MLSVIQFSSFLARHGVCPKHGESGSRWRQSLQGLWGRGGRVSRLWEACVFCVSRWGAGSPTVLRVTLSVTRE